MKIKTSVTLSEYLLQEIDNMSTGKINRSAFIETAVKSYINQKMKQEQQKRDLEILNKQADRLNNEAEDVLSFQEER